jgi:hypothetical protein
MFYVSQSDFFYDPKSSLYYGNKKGAYYRYNGTKSPPFEIVSSEEPSRTPTRTANGSMADQVAQQVNLNPIEESHRSDGKKKLIIKINTVAITSVVKKQAVDIERWKKKSGSESQESTKAPETMEARSKTTTRVIPVTAAPKPAASKGLIVKSSAGEPICSICMRKFPNAKKLKRHETESALHKENLAKHRELERSRSKNISIIPERQAPPPTRIEAPAPTQYVDRAKKRRNLYGESIMAPPIRPLELAPVVHAVVDPEINLGQKSVGNKLFQKMLFRSQAAGGDQSSSVVAAAPSTGARVVSDLTHNLRHDWARIESLAHGAIQRQRTGSSFTGGKGLGNNAPR